MVPQLLRDYRMFGLGLFGGAANDLITDAGAPDGRSKQQKIMLIH